MICADVRDAVMREQLLKIRYSTLERFYVVVFAERHWLLWDVVFAEVVTRMALRARMVSIALLLSGLTPLTSDSHSRSFRTSG